MATGEGSSAGARGAAPEAARLPASHPRGGTACGGVERRTPERPKARVLAAATELHPFRRARRRAAPSRITAGSARSPRAGRACRARRAGAAAGSPARAGSSAITSTSSKKRSSSGASVAPEASAALHVAVDSRPRSAPRRARARRPPAAARGRRSAPRPPPPSGEPVRPVVRRVDAVEVGRSRAAWSASASRATPPRSGAAERPRRAHELDRHVEQALEPLLDEVARRRPRAAPRRSRARPRSRAGTARSPRAAARTGRASRSACGRARSDRQVCRACPRPRAPCPASVCGSGPSAASGRYCSSIAAHDRLREAGEPRVLGADVALEVGELAHELGGLVGLREPRRLQRGLAAAELARRARAAASVLSANVPAPSKNVIEPSALGEPLDPDGHVALERERRVLEPAPRARCSLPAPHELRVAAVRDERERGARRAGSSAGATASPSRSRARAAARNRSSKRALEHASATRPGGRPPRACGRGPPAADRVERLDDLPAALLRVGLDVGRCAASRRSLGVGHLDLAVREAVALRTCRRSPRPSSRVELREQPADRPREAEPAVVPAHRLAEREAAHDRVEPLGQHLGERPGRARRRRGSRRARSSSSTATPCFLANPAAACSRSADRRALDPLVRRPLGQVVGRARRAAAARRRPRRLGAERALARAPAAGARRLAAGGGGQLLAADLKQQRRHLGPPARGRAARPSRARFRTRPMYAARSVTEIAPRASSRLNVCEHFSTWS